LPKRVQLTVRWMRIYTQFQCCSPVEESDISEDGMPRKASALRFCGRNALAGRRPEVREPCTLAGVQGWSGRETGPSP
jgi:hypothetical protein